MQWDWRMSQLEAGRSELSFHKTGPSSAGSVQWAQPVALWGEQLQAAGHKPCADPQELGCGPGLWTWP